jgi:hypothetical protein
MASILRAINFSRISDRFWIDTVAASIVRERDCSELEMVTRMKPSDATAMPAQIRTRKDFVP